MLEQHVNVVTLGNHSFSNRTIVEHMDEAKNLVRPLNYGEGTPGKGYVTINYNGKKIGLYKDENEKEYKVIPKCMHLGCELSWNSLDKTWDCPCHGSRYTFEGKLIYGPSTKDLKIIE